MRALAEVLGVPREIIDRTPTAGLWAGQTDEEEMGVTYDELDEWLLTGRVAPDVRAPRGASQQKCPQEKHAASRTRTAGEPLPSPHAALSIHIRSPRRQPREGQTGSVAGTTRKRGDDVNILMLSWEYPPRRGWSRRPCPGTGGLWRRGHKVTVLSQDGGCHGSTKIRACTSCASGRPCAPRTLGYVHQLNHLMLAKSLELVQQGGGSTSSAHDWIVAFAASGLKQALRRP